MYNGFGAYQSNPPRMRNPTNQYFSTHTSQERNEDTSNVVKITTLVPFKTNVGGQILTAHLPITATYIRNSSRYYSPRLY